MDKSLYSQRQVELQRLLRELREKSDLRQQDVADLIDEPQSFVSKFESGERRLDILELREVCQALGTSLAQFVGQLEKRLRD